MDRKTENCMTLAALRLTIKANPSLRAIRNWCVTGKTNRITGNVHRLESYMEVDVRWSSTEAYDRFVDALSMLPELEVE